MANTRLTTCGIYLNSLLDKLSSLANGPLHIEEQAVSIMVRDIKRTIAAIKSGANNNSDQYLSPFEMHDLIATITAAEIILKEYEADPPGQTWKMTAVDFFKQRKNDVANTHLCYTLNRGHVTNLLCIQLARLVDPDKINSLLLPGVREEDIYGNSINDIPLGQFILTDDKQGFISLSDIVDTVFNRSTESEADPYLTTTAEGASRSLTKNELLRMGGVYERLERIRSNFSSQGFFSWLLSANKTRLHDELIALRDGLRRGDVSHGGSEMNAGADANKAIVKFRVYYEALSTEKRDRLRAFSYGNKTMGEQLDLIFRDPAEASRNAGTGVNYCLQIIGGKIECIINSNRRELLGISDSKEECLLRMKNELLQEISTKNALMAPPSSQLSLREQFGQLVNSINQYILDTIHDSEKATLLILITRFIDTELERLSAKSHHAKLNCYLDLLFAIRLEAIHFHEQSPQDNHLVLNEIFRRVTLIASAATAFISIRTVTSSDNWKNWLHSYNELQAYPFIIDGESDIGYLSKYMQLPNTRRCISTPQLTELRRQAENERLAQQREAARAHALQERRESSMFRFFYASEQPQATRACQWPLSAGQTTALVVSAAAVTFKLLN